VLVGPYVSKGCAPGEVRGMNGAEIDWGEQPGAAAVSLHQQSTGTTIAGGLAESEPDSVCLGVSSCLLLFLHHKRQFNPARNTD
jgi:hypothetical protein